MNRPRWVTTCILRLRPAVSLSRIRARLPRGMVRGAGDLPGQRRWC